MDKYFYIAVPSEDFEEVKHTYYEAPSTYLRVYNSNRIDELEAELYTIQQQNNQMKRVLEIVRDTLAHKVHDDRTSHSLWKAANDALEGGSDNES